MIQNFTRIHIFDVEHGECSAIETPSGHLMLIGVGHNSSTNWRPSTWLQQRRQKPSVIVLSNLDHDHLSDLPNFSSAHLRPEFIKSNHYIDPEWIRSMKIAQSGGIHPAVHTALEWMGTTYSGGLTDVEYGLEKNYFYHSPTKFQDTNNLSVVTFLRYSNCGVMFPGDIELAGWREFLRDPFFVECLRKTNILIASHHGRSGGYCEDIFAYCKPDTVIISDKSRIHGTQHHNLYDKHCGGLDFSGKTRKVITTRNDGKITIEIPEAENYKVYINQLY